MTSKITILILAIFLAVALGLPYLWLQSRTRAAVPTSPDSIEDRITAEDVARVLGRNIRKMTITVPKDAYCVYVWSECWHKGNPVPKLILLGDAGGTFERATILFDIPTSAKPEWYFSIGNTSISGRMKDMIGPDDGHSGFLAPLGVIKPTDDINLATVVPANKDGSPIGAMGAEPNPLAEVTYIFRARFIPGFAMRTPEWNGRSVEFIPVAK